MSRETTRRRHPSWSRGAKHALERRTGGRRGGGRRRERTTPALGFRGPRRERVDQRRMGRGSRRPGGRGQGSFVSTGSYIPRFWEGGLSPRGGVPAG